MASAFGNENPTTFLTTIQILTLLPSPEATRTTLCEKSLGGWGHSSLASFQGSKEGFVKCLMEAHGHCTGARISQMPFLRHIEYVTWIQALGHFHPVGLCPWVQHPNHHLKRQVGYRCHHLIVHCAQTCTPKFIPCHPQEPGEVMFLVGFWVHTQAYTLRVADICDRGTGRVSTIIP